MTSRGPVQPHQHGTITGYTKGCRDTCCRRANALRRQRIIARQISGSPAPTDLLPPTDTRAQILVLRQTGYTDAQIAALAGVSDMTVGRLRRGVARHVTRETAERLLAIPTLRSVPPPVDRLAARYVPADGARRRLQALRAIGWDLAELGRRLGYPNSSTLDVVSNGRAQQITPALHQRIADLYDQLWETPGGSTRARRLGLRHRWATPLELDDDQIDDPAYQPELHRPDPVVVRREAREARREQVRRLTAAGLSAAQIARRLDMHERQVVRDRRAS